MLLIIQKHLFIDTLFWRSSARKIFAVPKDDFERRFPDQIHTSQHSQNPAIVEKLDLILQKLDRNERPTTSTALERPLRATFKSVICQTTASSPIVVSLCCKQVLGCSTCLDQCPDRRCPHCRADEFESVTLGIFEEILSTLTNELN